MIRDAADGDVGAINAITNWAIAETHAHFATDPEPIEQTRALFAGAGDRYPWLVAEVDGEVVGFARAKAWNPRGAYAGSVEISVYLLPAHHGKGLGKALYARLIEAVRERGFTQAIGGIALPNEASVRLHEAFGMRHVGTFERIGIKDGVWRDVGYWQLGLGG